MLILIITRNVPKLTKSRLKFQSAKNIVYFDRRRHFDSVFVTREDTPPPLPVKWIYNFHQIYYNTVRPSSHPTLLFTTFSYSIRMSPTRNGRRNWRLRQLPNASENCSWVTKNMVYIWQGGSSVDCCSCLIYVYTIYALNISLLWFVASQRLGQYCTDHPFRLVYCVGRIKVLGDAIVILTHCHPLLQPSWLLILEIRQTFPSHLMISLALSLVDRQVAAGNQAWKRSVFMLLYC